MCIRKLFFLWSHTYLMIAANSVSPGIKEGKGDICCYCKGPISFVFH